MTKKIVKTWSVLLLVLITPGILWSQEDDYFVERAIPVKNVNHLTGFFGDRIEKNQDVYLKQFPIEDYMDFVAKQDHTDWTWVKAEQHGKWIESAILASAQSGDKELRAKVMDVFSRLLSLQEEEGYVGPTAKEIRTPDSPLRGMDPYELYFVQHALITASEQLDDPRGLDAAKALGDYFIKYIGPGKAEFWPSPDYHYPENVGRELSGQSNIAGHSVHYGWEGTLLIDPMSRLYLKTRDPKYLEWCIWAVNNLDKWSGFESYSKLDAVAEGKIGVDELQPYVHSHTFHMNFLGFLNLYRITGEKTYLDKVVAAWNDIAERQMYITGGVSVAEHYENSYIKPLEGNIVETCATMSWMQLTQYLLELTGDVKYADAMERLTWNHVFAAQSEDGAICKYHTAPNGVKPEGYFRNHDCCTASGGRILSMMPSFIYAQKENEIFINQFVGSEATFDLGSGDDFTLEQKTGFPEKDQINLIVKSSNETASTINIRIPQWSQNPTVKLNGKMQKNVFPGEYFSLNRNWKKGDKITINLPMELEWVEHENYLDVTLNYLEGGEHMYEGVPDQENAPYALMRGPVVYMVDNIWLDAKNPDYPKDVASDVKVMVSTNPDYPETKLKTKDQILGPVYEVPVVINGTETKVPMVPFSNAGQWYRDEDSKGDRYAPTYSYAIWLKKAEKL
ncbi:hypothetical protein SAMN04487907_1145 [Zunongwangia mangrovi]|uniref:DUF1680 family protein n=1 Tax=Zunongwangia mangrovi TaxID=1334022 RepID=A0A1I1N305_9FLAO|nr:beta-L-arabinofuranosidase domain-containing protein [Zunongwangia mangrovi]SFC92009.1 hypothetical protein SAMN04487907_1145 [Zunongwangia mangrovi]